jgi:hypothetical protein
MVLDARLIKLVRMFLLDTDKAQAVLFFSKEGISKELLFPEFEALLDGYVPIEEWAGTAQKAAYIEFNSAFAVTAAVFFTMAFDAKGAVDGSWNLPLLDMARTVSKGPDLGAGPIHLASASQCPIEYFKSWLWDPDLQPDSLLEKHIKQSLKRNRLGVHFRAKTTPDTTGSTLSPQDMQQLEERLTSQISKQYTTNIRELNLMIETQNARLAQANSEKNTALHLQQHEYEKKLEHLKLALEERTAALTDAQKRHENLKETIDGQIQKMEGLREYFEHKLRRIQSSDVDTIETVRSRLETQIDAKVESATAELNELLRMKDIELQYLREHEEKLRLELQKTRQEQQATPAVSMDELLASLSRQGVNFATYQPGAGHITIPYQEIERFTADPLAFTASYCGVDTEIYREWLKHYQMPICGAMENGELCGENIPRVASPAEFIVGVSECCEKHAPETHIQQSKSA